MATHNGEKFIEKQLRSILKQLREDDEIVISDDGSVDKTIDIIKEVNDSRIRIVHYKQNKVYTKNKYSSYYYASANFMNALKNSLGNYILLSDQDDIWNDNKVEMCLNELRKNDIVSHNFGLIDEYDNIIEKKYLWNYDVTPWKIKMFLKTPYRGCCLAFTREVLNFSVPYPQKLFLHDFWLGYNSVIGGYKFKYIDEPLIMYRRHKQNVSEIHPQNSFFFKLSYRIVLLTQILLQRLKILL